MMSQTQAEKKKLTAIRLTNRQGSIEILGGLAGGPIFVCFVGWLWFSGNVTVAEPRGMVLLLGSVLLPFFAIYWMYRALMLTTLWIQIGRTVQIRKLLGKRIYDYENIGAILLDNEPITMDSGLPGVDLEVGKARYLVVKSHANKSLGRIRVSGVGRTKMIRVLQEAGWSKLLANNFDE